MGPTKKLIYGAIVATLCFFGNTYTAAANEETYFVATAYYSPLPDQESYITGSYVGDVRLNGEGVTTASGKGVFPGLLAGPKNYPFGTKIYFEGFGIGSIEDRGGAIRKAGAGGHCNEYDCLDIWMGYGDEGLQRAIHWGRKTVKAKIVVPSAEVSLNFGDSEIGFIGNFRVNPEDSGDNVKKLQELFKKIDIYTGEIDGKYESIKNEIVDFQLKNGIITGVDDEAAGYFGPKTIAVLRSKYGSFSTHLLEEAKSIFAEYNHKHASEFYKIILQYGDLQIDEDSTDKASILLFQEMMSEIGEYSGPIDGQYSSVRDALVQLQIKIGLIPDASHWYAGSFGNRTKTALWTYYEFNTGNETISAGIKLGNKNSAYILNLDEKLKLESALKKVSQKLKNQQKKTGKSPERVLQSLDKQISETLPKISDKVMKAKLVYLQTLL